MTVNPLDALLRIITKDHGLSRSKIIVKPRKTVYNRARARAQLYTVGAGLGTGGGTGKNALYYWTKTGKNEL